MVRLRRELARILAEEHPDLLRAGLLLTHLKGGAVDTAPWELVVDRMAAELRRRTRDDSPGPDLLEALNRYLFRDWGFSPVKEASGPSDVLLEDVLRHRRGVVEALTILLLEIGWRAGLPLVPVAGEGRLLVRHDDPAGRVLLDVARRGRILGPDDLRRLAITEPETLPAVPARELLHRLLRRLKAAYRDGDDLLRLEATTDLLLLLGPDTPQDRRDRGLARFERDNLVEAKADLKRYLELQPDAGDAPVIQEYLAEIERRLRALSRSLGAGLGPPPG